MKIKTAWAIQSMALCLLFNLVFTVVIFHMASRVIDASHQWILALSAPGAPAMPANAHTAVLGLSALIAQTRGWLMPVLFVLASAFTLLLWFFIFWAGGRQIERMSGGGCRVPDVGPRVSDERESGPEAST